MSGSYERMNFITSFGFSIRWRRQFLQTLPGSDSTLKVIDLLTGMGESWKPIKQKYPNCELTALDFSEEMLKHAHRRNDKTFEKSVAIKQADILQSNLPADHYDIITCSFGLKTFNEQQLQVLAHEIKRILKEGGYFTFVEVSEPKNWLLRIAYSFYLGKVIPVLGRLFLGDPREYKMLWKYTSAFKNADHASTIFAKAGLKVSSLSFFFGCATGFYGTK
jgi:demethylmenaquinone methyltransferase/2-methoxy-6-polyprenyl-1,4-benzoquinol methylase